MQGTKQAVKHRRITGPERDRWTKDCVRRYASGESIRQIATSTGRSYGAVHKMLTEAGVVMKPRGGARRQLGK
jgi:hypothetical protein